MTGISGFPDFLAPSGEPVQFLTSAAISTAGVQTVDLTNFVNANHQGLLVVWRASGGWAGLPIVTSLLASGGIISFDQLTRVEDGRTGLLTYAGQVILSDATLTLGLTVAPPADIPGTATGTIFVFGITSNFYTVPIIKKTGTQVTFSTGEISCPGAGATTTVLANPPDGQYYRVHSMCGRIGAVAPGANVGLWKTLSGGLVMIPEFIQATAFQTYKNFVDLTLSEGVKFQNNANQNFAAEILFEQLSF